MKYFGKQRKQIKHHVTQAINKVRPSAKKVFEFIKGIDADKLTKIGSNISNISNQWQETKHLYKNMTQKSGNIRDLYKKKQFEEIASRIGHGIEKTKTHINKYKELGGNLSKLFE